MDLLVRFDGGAAMTANSVRRRGDVPARAAKLDLDLTVGRVWSSVRQATDQVSKTLKHAQTYAKGFIETESKARGGGGRRGVSKGNGTEQQDDLAALLRTGLPVIRLGLYPSLVQLALNRCERLGRLSVERLLCLDECSEVLDRFRLKERTSGKARGGMKGRTDVLEHLSHEVDRLLGRVDELLLGGLD